MQLTLDSEVKNREVCFFYLLIFRWLALAYVLFFIIVQKSIFQLLNHYVLFFALFYVFCLTLLRSFIVKYLSEKPVILGADLFLCVLFLIFGGWARAWFFYSLTPIAAAALFWGSVQGCVFATTICIIHFASPGIDANLLTKSQDFIRFDNALFPIASFAFATGAAIVFASQRQKSAMIQEGLLADVCKASNELKEAESQYANKIVKAMRGALSMVGLTDHAEILSLLVEETRELTEAEKVAAVLFDRKGGKVKIDFDTLVVKGRKDQHLESWWGEELNKIAKTVVEKESRREGREHLQENRTSADRALLKSNKDTSLLCIPLKVGNKYVGILSAFNTYPYFFTDEEIEMLSVLADQAALALTDSQRSKDRPKVSNLEFEKELERITTKCLQSQEAERKRISRELHDNTAQSLTHLVMRLQKVHDTMIPAEQEELKKSMAKLIEISEHTLEEVHEMAFQMRPAILEDLGLIETIRWYISHYLGTATLAVNFATLQKEVKLPPHVEIAVLRIIQEGLTNIRKYARAAEAFVDLELIGDELVVTIKDDGEGFDVEKTLAKSAEKKSLGLKGMKERAELLGGSLEIISHTGDGTKITATVPLRFKR